MKRSYFMAIVLLMPLSSMSMKRDGQEPEEIPAEKFQKIESAESVSMTLEPPAFDNLPPEIQAYLLPFITLPLRTMTANEINDRFEPDMAQLRKTLQNLRATNKKMKELIDDKGVRIGLIATLVKHYHIDFVTIAEKLGMTDFVHTAMHRVIEAFGRVHGKNYTSPKKYQGNRTIKFRYGLGFSTGSSLLVGEFTKENVRYFFIAKFNARGELDISFGKHGLLIVIDIINQNKDFWTDYMMPGRIMPASLFGTTAKGYLIVSFYVEYPAGSITSYCLFFTPDGKSLAPVGRHGLIPFVWHMSGRYYSLLGPCLAKIPWYQQGGIQGAIVIKEVSEKPDVPNVLYFTLGVFTRYADRDEWIEMIVPVNVTDGRIRVDLFNPVDATKLDW